MSSATLNSCKVFIVEDDDSIRLLYQKFLILSGFIVMGLAKNGDEAVTMYKTFPDKPDIIIMDNYMPIKDGIQATWEIMQFDDESKIIFMSADKTLITKAITAGARIFLEKPFSLMELATIIKKLKNNTLAVKN